MPSPCDQLMEPNTPKPNAAATRSMRLTLNRFMVASFIISNKEPASAPPMGSGFDLDQVMGEGSGNPQSGDDCASDMTRSMPGVERNTVIAISKVRYFR